MFGFKSPADKALRAGFGASATQSVVLGAIAGAVMAGPIAAFGQTQAPAPTPAPTPARYNPGPVEFDPVPLKVESMGLTMLLPTGATSQAASVGTLATVRIQPAPETGQKTGESTWVMDIQTIGELAPDPAAAGKAGAAVEPLSNTVMAERSIKEVLKTYGKLDAKGNVLESQARLLFREQNLKIKRGDAGQALSAERFYMSFPQGDARVVRGSTFCQVAPGRFATFNLFVKEQDFTKVRPIYEAMVASASLNDPAEAGIARAALVEAGKSVLAGLNEADYRAVIEARGERWDRLFKLPTSGDDALAVERGYRRTRAWIGRKGELDPSRDQAKWKKSEETEGYLISYEYRLLMDPENPPADGKWSMSDGTALYFVSLDGRDEMWVIRQTERGPNSRPGTSKETGARADANKMQVTIEGPNVSPTIIKPLFNAEGYISQVQTFLLPQLLVRAAAPADYGFYYYQSATQKVQLRTDSLRRPADRPALWELSVHLTEDSPPIRMILNDKGEILRSELSEGWTWEPTTKEKLVSLWQRKGLPMN